MNTLTAYARNSAIGQFIVYDPGIPEVNVQYFQIADVICLFENSYTKYTSAPNVVHQTYASEGTSFVYSEPNASLTEMNAVISGFGSSGWHSLFITETDGYTSTGTDWSDFVNRMSAQQFTSSDKSRTTAIILASVFGSLLVVIVGCLTVWR